MNTPADQSLASDLAEKNPSMDDILARFMRGDLRGEFGLSVEQLRTGLMLAQGHMIRGAFGEALRIYMSLVLCEPMNIDYQVGLANSAHFMNEHDVALHAAAAVIALAPADPRGYLLSGRSCFLIGNHTEAREDLEDVVRFATSQTGIVLEARRLLDGLAIAALNGSA